MTTNTTTMTDVKGERDRLMTKFPYIVAWGKMLGSFGYFIVNQCAKAEQENAPQDSIYYSRDDKKWHTASDLKTEVKADLDLYKDGKKGGILSDF